MPAKQRSSAKRKENRSVSRLRGKERKALRAELQREAHIRNKKNPEQAPWALAKQARILRRRALQILKKTA